MEPRFVPGIGLALTLAACGSDSPVSAPTATPSAPEATPAQPDAPTPPPLPSAPVVTEAATQAHAFVQQRMSDGPLPEHPLVHFTPIARHDRDPDGPALASFYTALRDLEAGKDEEGKVRIAVYGASSVAVDRYTAYLRGYLQHRFGDAGVGFVSLVPLWRWHRQNEVRLDASKHWSIEHAQKENGRLDGDYGLIGASAYTTNKRAKATLTANASAFSDPAKSTLVELYYLAQPGGGSFEVTLGPGKRAKAVKVSTKADARGSAYQALAFEGSPLPIQIKAKGDGEVRLFGATLETAGPGIVLDELGVGGTRSANHLDWTESIWRDNLQRRAPSLVVFAYGANEAVDEDEPLEVYRENLDKVLDRYAAALPGVACLLVGPQDFPMKEVDDTGEETGTWVERPRMDPITLHQRESARTHGCGFFDTRAMMGGEGQMQPWVAADPPLAKGDHLHLTPLGYVYMGRTLTDALMAEYDQTAG